jgi:hypothetical protein
MRIKLPSIPVGLDGECLRFFTRSDLWIAMGYERVVWGDRGPYVEFATGSILPGVLHVPDSQRWRLTTRNPRIYYQEWRTNDECDVMVYYQLREVGYADYKPGFWYISPVDLKTDGYGELFER